MRNLYRGHPSDRARQPLALRKFHTTRLQAGLEEGLLLPVTLAWAVDIRQFIGSVMNTAFLSFYHWRVQ